MKNTTHCGADRTASLDPAAAKFLSAFRKIAADYYKRCCLKFSDDDARELARDLSKEVLRIKSSDELSVLAKQGLLLIEQRKEASLYAVIPEPRLVNQTQIKSRVPRLVAREAVRVNILSEPLKWLES